MTANHAHTPSNEQVTTFFKTLRMMYQTRMVELQHPSDDKDHMDEYGQNFDKLIAARDAHIEAAAEQRGAERGWDEGQKSGLRYAERALAAQKIGRPDLPGPPTTNPYRADQEGDDEKH